MDEQEMLLLMETDDANALVNQGGEAEERMVPMDENDGSDEVDNEDGMAEMTEDGEDTANNKEDNEGPYEEEAIEEDGENVEEAGGEAKDDKMFEDAGEADNQDPKDGKGDNDEEDKTDEMGEEGGGNTSGSKSEITSPEEVEGDNEKEEGAREEEDEKALEEGKQERTTGEVGNGDNGKITSSSTTKEGKEREENQEDEEEPQAKDAAMEGQISGEDGESREDRGDENRADGAETSEKTAAEDEDEDSGKQKETSRNGTCLRNEDKEEVEQITSSPKPDSPTDQASTSRKRLHSESNRTKNDEESKPHPEGPIHMKKILIDVPHFVPRLSSLPPPPSSSLPLLNCEFVSIDGEGIPAIYTNMVERPDFIASGKAGGKICFTPDSAWPERTARFALAFHLRSSLSEQWSLSTYVTVPVEKRKQTTVRFLISIDPKCYNQKPDNIEDQSRQNPNSVIHWEKIALVAVVEADGVRRRSQRQFIDFSENQKNGVRQKRQRIEEPGTSTASPEVIDLD